MIKRDHPQLSISQQCKLVRLSRSAFYYAPVGIGADTLAMMKEIDRVFTKYPFFGSRQIAAYLRREGVVIGRHRVRRLMAQMGLEAIYKRPRTSQPHRHHLRAGPEWLPVSRGYHGLGVAQGPELAAIEYDACRLLRRCPERSHRQIWPAGDHEHRSRISVYGIGLDHDADRGRRAHLNGWAWPLSGQHFYRTAVAEPEAGGDLSRRDH